MNWKLSLSFVVPLILAACAAPPPPPPPPVHIAPVPPPIAYAQPAEVVGPVVDNNTPVLRYDDRQDRRGVRRYGRNARQYYRTHPYYNARYVHRSNKYYDRKYCKPGQIYRRASVVTKDGKSVKTSARCVSR